MTSCDVISANDSARFLSEVKKIYYAWTLSILHVNKIQSKFKKIHILYINNVGCRKSIKFKPQQFMHTVTVLKLTRCLSKIKGIPFLYISRGHYLTSELIYMDTNIQRIHEFLAL